MSVDVEPLELSFRRPFTEEVSQTLTIKNTTSSPLAFKVKTTAPKQYCVRPNAGRIEPGQDFGVTVLLQAMKSDPPLETKCRDKFLVQSAPITAEKEFVPIASVLEKADKSQIQERKIRVSWLPSLAAKDQVSAAPPSGTSTPMKQSIVSAVSEIYTLWLLSFKRADNISTQVDDTPNAARNYATPRARADSTPRGSIDPSSHTPDSKKDDDKSERPRSAVSQAVTAVSDSAQTSYEELKAKLAQAEAQLANYKDSGLRQRGAKTAAGGDQSKSNTTKIAPQPALKQAEGVSVQLVAILCLISFLLAYFFF
ncbi:hypothetical protein CDD82_5740 [Ophiocordyceps australis]|uniref:MSP domain-containing protein n=1 Tax=Ophiocordyceps australis TaxID=1399860 RepID=A0A2C5Y496_9HYPO|nr:hypothetical protein CDD82_5740 [Ophiocordyceps australis]